MNDLGLMGNGDRGFTFGAAWRGTVALFVGSWGLLCGASVVAAVILVVGGLIPIVNLIAGILLSPLLIGVNLIAVRRARGELAEMGTMFEPFREFLPLVGLTLLVVLINAIPVLVGSCLVGILAVAFGLLKDGQMVSGVSELVVFAFAVLGVVPIVLACLYLYVRTMFAGLVYLDMPREERTVVGAILRCWEVTGRAVWSLAGFYVVMGLLAGLTVMLLFVGILLVGLPLYMAAVGVGYVLLFPRLHVSVGG